MGRGLIVTLVLSLGLNVFAVGFIAGRIISDEKPPRYERIAPGGGGLDNPLRLLRYAETLPPEVKDEFREKIRTQLPGLREQQQQMSILRGDIENLLAATDWDRDAVLAKAAELRAAQERQRELLYTMFIDAFDVLPAEERKRLVETQNRLRLKRQERKQRQSSSSPQE